MDFSKIPEKGIMYALYTDKVVYRKYDRKEFVEDQEATDKLLELHLFDTVAEYRYIKKRNGKIEALIRNDTVEHQDLYTEKIITLGNKKEKPDKESGFVEVVNYITYDENDLMRIENYRLKEVE